ncbi:hypothetical protein CEH05_17575 [Halobacillus halophilus]|uniref:Uncharacterized protein n=1 Tax=Halobacillus halophilus (strain ATCC 35676 / DSM 2266 / JCM 20832 / KCTC 3685 / LMG 17431 / NBRC 102448 / NCIMB 2269) TaxID=866895 RepID=I0JRZ6_HALH3|nr:hypothetical protein [Halobacillus halophilus]ASF40867.1 hypothetical protein CEH05_17575 [Halobacillus halophilus]CCG46917.1 hypothetical protein HBHAL_4579 [Halobacillus halophilus DSM 2266]
MKYRTASDLKDLLLEDFENVVNKIPQEKLDVYLYLHREFQNTYVPDDSLYQFIFRYFFRLDNPSLTNEFETSYFKLMEEQRKEERPNIVQITKSLYEIKNHKGNPTMQFPLAASMLHAINPQFPTYDSDIVKAFDFSSTYHLSGFEKKMKRYMKQYQHAYRTYTELIDDEAMEPMFKHFDERFRDYNLPKIKKLDLMTAQLGNIIQ